MTIVTGLPEYTDPDDLRRVIAELDEEIKPKEKELARLRRARGYYTMELQKITAPLAPPEPPAWPIRLAQKILQLRRKN